MQSMLISVIVATYNRPDALRLVIQSLMSQTDRNFEILIADDGSTQVTADLIGAFQASATPPLNHVWQADEGFRLSRIRNLAIQHAKGAYLIFLDGDCVVQPDFVAQHRKLAKHAHMVTGSRILLEKGLTDSLCASQQWSYADFKKAAFMNWTKGELNKILPLYIKLPFFINRSYSTFVWRRIKGCNLACWAVDARAIQGFDESLVGWGHEDADFVFRLHAHGVRRVSGAWATEVFHLWHRMADKTTAEKNAEIVRAKILAKSKA
jgi:glycosyltransferase involved in cell wall biosynthesis